MRRRILVIPVALAVLAPGATAAGAPPSPVAAEAAACKVHYGLPGFHRIARRAYDGKREASSFERRTLSRVKRCQKHPRKARRRIRLHSERYRSNHHQQLAVIRLTPYSGGGQRWAIPWYIVSCESGGSWTAKNGNALGPYQLLGWGAPYPAYSRAARLENHRIAARLWSGGSGASHWTQCLG